MEEEEVRRAADAVASEGAVGLEARVKALEMLLQVVSNILAPPTSSGEADVEAARARYARLKLASGPYRRTLTPLPSAEAFLRAVGFKRAVIEFQEYMVLTPSPASLTTLAAGKASLEAALRRARERASERRTVQVDPRAEEQLRREQALARIRDNQVERAAAASLPGRT